MDCADSQAVEVPRFGDGQRARRKDPPRPQVGAHGRYLAVLVLAVVAAGAGHPAPGPLIRCPDWQQPGQVLRVSPPPAVPRPAPKLPVGAAAGKGVAAPAAPGCIRHAVKAGDTLGRIARQHLGDAGRHPEIAAANPEAARDPRRLRLGTVLNIGCRPPPPATEAASRADRPRGFWARLFGDPAVAAPAAIAPQEDDAPAEVLRTAPEIPVWKAEKGEYLIDVLERWGSTAGYAVIIEDRGDWRFAVPFEFEGPLRGALREVIKGFGSGTSAPLLVVYGNRVVRVGAAR